MTLRWRVEGCLFLQSYIFRRTEFMLVLSRKSHQRIMISDDVTITVVEIRGDKVRL